MSRKRGGGKRVARRTHADLHTGISTLNEDEALELVEKLGEDTFLLILDQVQDPRNLGACLRSAECAGVDLIAIPSGRSVGITEVVRHVAAGAAESLPIARVRNLSNFLRSLSELGIRLVGTSDQAKSTLYDLDLKDLSLLLLERKVVEYEGLLLTVVTTLPISPCREAWIV